MGKFSNAQKDIFSIFASPSWASEGIATYPNNFVAAGNSEEFVRVTVLQSGPALSEISSSGMLIAEIFTAKNIGPSRSLEIADKLDTFLSRKSLNTSAGGVTQLFQSSIRADGYDKDNPNLFRSTFSIPFSYFGVV